MVNFMVLFAITVLIAAYSGIVYFTGTSKKSTKFTKSHYGILCIVFVVLAIIELIVFNML